MKGKTITSKKLSLITAEAALEKKAYDILILEIRELTSIADFFVICSGKSDRQVQAIATNIETELRKRGIKPLGIEGFREGRWVLLDYGDVVVHVFYAPVRAFYDLEGLWADAPRLKEWEEKRAALADLQESF